jgi:hypothetical protein
MKKPGLAIVIGAPGGPGKGAPDAGGVSSSGQTDSVPISALQMPDDQEQMQPPEVGDEVNYQVAGKVVSIDGDTAQVKRTSINGQPVDDGSDTAPDNDQDPNEDADEKALQTEAQGLDQSSQNGQGFQ